MSRTALILMDLQAGIIGLLPNGLPSDYLSKVAATAAAARAARIPVIYVRVAFRPGFPESSDRNIMTARVAASGGFVAGSPSTEFPAEIAPLETDIIIQKRRPSALAGTDLEQILKAGGIETLVLGGIVTSGCVLSTVRQAFDLDYSITVLEDLCLDRDEKVHEILVKRIFPTQGTVTKASEWVKKVQETE